MPDDSSGSNLRHRTLVGLGWRSLTTGGRILLRLSIGVVLARLLGPEAFGLIGLATIVIGFGDLFVDIGLGPAIVQRKTITERHVRAAFTLSVSGGLLLSLITFSVAPFAAQLMGDEELIPIIECLALTFLFSGGGVVARSLLKRKLNFRSVLVVDLGSYVIGYGGLGITMALLGYGVWSLVIASLVQAGLGAVIAYWLSYHSLWLLFSWHETRELVRFGSGLTLARLINYCAVKGDYFIVGRTLGAGPLGLYTRAYQLMKTPLTHLVKVLVDVLFPALSKIQDDPPRLRRVFLQSVATIVFCTAPLVGTIVILAPEVVIGLYGEKWTGAIVPLQILGATGICRALYNAASAFVRAHGDVFKIAACQAVYAGSTIGGAWLGAHYYGIEGASMGVAGSIILMYMMMMGLAQYLTGTSTWKNMRMHGPGALLALPVMGGAYTGKIMGSNLIGNAVVTILLGLLFACISGIVFIRLFPSRWMTPIIPILLNTAKDYLPYRAYIYTVKWVRPTMKYREA